MGFFAGAEIIKLIADEMFVTTMPNVKRDA
jgi:hypothetical protein